jgi:hypothetical protein
VGRPKHLRIMPGGALEMETAEKGAGTTSKVVTSSTSTVSNVGAAAGGVHSVFLGRKLNEHRGAFYLEHPMEHGAVTPSGWDAMERIWEVCMLSISTSW